MTLKHIYYISINFQNIDLESNDGAREEEVIEVIFATNYFALYFDLYFDILSV